MRSIITLANSFRTLLGLKSNFCANELFLPYEDQYYRMWRITHLHDKYKCKWLKKVQKLTCNKLKFKCNKTSRVLLNLNYFQVWMQRVSKIKVSRSKPPSESLRNFHPTPRRFFNVLIKENAIRSIHQRRTCSTFQATTNNVIKKTFTTTTNGSPISMKIFKGMKTLEEI
jgi:hypothetical protein